MALLAAGSSTAELVQNALLPNGVVAVSTAAQIAPDVDEGLRVGTEASATYPRLDFTGVSDMWASFHMTSLTTALTGVFINIGNGTTPLFRFNAVTQTTFRLEYWNGSAWVAVGTAVSFGANIRYRIDIHVVMSGTVGLAELYVNGGIVHSFSGNTIYTAATTVNYLQLSSTSNISNGVVYSAVAVMDEDTRPYTYIKRSISGAGAVSDWSNDFNAIDETGFDDADTVQATTDGQIDTFAKAALPATYSSGYVVSAVAITARARKGTSGPANLQLVARSGTTNGTSTNRALTAAFAPYQAIFSTDPATGTAWTYSGADSAQIGIKAVT